MKNKSVIIMTVMVCVLSCLNIALFVGLIYNKDKDGNNDGSNGGNNIVNNITNNVVEYDTIKVESLETAINSSGDVLFAATAEFREWQKQGKELPF